MVQVRTFFLLPSILVLNMKMKFIVYKTTSISNYGIELKIRYLFQEISVMFTYVSVDFVIST